MGPRLQEDFREVARTCRLSGPVLLGGCKARDVHICPGAVSCVSKATRMTKTSPLPCGLVPVGFQATRNGAHPAT